MSNIGDEPSSDRNLGKAKNADAFKFDDEKPGRVIKNNDVDDGVITFGIWLNARINKDESQVPIAVKKFVPDQLALLNDHVLQKEVSVAFTEGVPSCKECGDSQDCAHVGFAICLEQRCRRSGLD